MARIVVVEDEADIREILEYNLIQDGHRVHVAATGEAGLRLIRAHRPELVLLDRMLPDRSGTEVCKALKKDEATRHICIVMVTAKGEEIDRVIGFELGVDDYITKPFSVRELLLRVQAVLRRREVAPPSGMEIRELRIDRDAHRVFVSGEPVVLTSLEFKLLVTLVERRERVQSRVTLLSDVWGIDTEITSRTIDTHVKRLREKLGDAGKYVETVRGVGYRFSENALGDA